MVHGLGFRGGSFKQVICLSSPGEFLHPNGMHDLTLVLGHRSPLEILWDLKFKAEALKPIKPT